MIIKPGKGFFFFFLMFIHFTYIIVVLYFYKDYSVLTRILTESFPPSHPGPLPLDWASRAKVSYLIYCSVFFYFFLS